jgi:pimeloyl-ACP methyl ester carboxylesterase
MSTIRLAAWLSCMVWICVALMPQSMAAPHPASDPQSAIDLDRFDSRKTSIKLPNGETLAYIDMGPRTGRPVLLVHGYTDSARDWVPLIPYLSKNLRLIVVDLRGHGLSSKPECCYTRYDFAYDLKLLLDHLGIQRADVVGHSLGSMIAQNFGETWPERTGKLVLISSTGGPGCTPTKEELRQRETAFDYRGAIRGLRDPIDPNSKFMVLWWSSPTFVDPDFLRRQREDAAKIPARVWLAILDQGVNMAGLQSMLPLLTEPTLLIWGENDPIMLPEYRKTLMAALPSAQVKVFPGLGHNPFWEAPRDVAAVVNGFLAQ